MANTEIDASGVDIALSLRPLAMLRGDPTIRVAPGLVERATWTPDGPGAVRVRWRSGTGRPGTGRPGVSGAEIRTFGDGADWLSERAPQFIGATDDASGFDPISPVVRGLWRRFHGDRVPRTNTAWHDVAWAIVQQRVHRRDAALQWKRLVQSLGQPAPGIDGLYVPPEPRRLADTPPWSLCHLGIDAQRSAALINAARHASALQRLTAEPVDKAMAKVQHIRGVGPWTASCLSAFTFGHRDTVIVGDSGIPSLIAATLAGERRADDARMRELLEPYRPHRYRVLRLCFAARMGPAGK